MDSSMELMLEKLSELKRQLVCAAETELAKGIEGVDTKEMGEVMDMIKDLAETERNCREACYYKTVTEAMEGEERMGYNHNRYASGRYAPSGHGNMTRGYNHNLREMPYVDEYLNDPEFESRMRRFGYSEGQGTPMSDAARHGYAYGQYKMASKHYTQTSSQTDKEAMMTHANEHLANTITSLRDIWDHADPAMRKRMKADMAKLVEDMDA